MRSTNNLELPLSPSAEVSFPFAYSVDERFDLEHYLRPHHDDPGKVVLSAWARQFIRTDGYDWHTRVCWCEMNQYDPRAISATRRTRRRRHADAAGPR